MGEIKIATETTKMAMPEVRIGYFPDVGVTHFLSKLPNGIGLYIALTASFIKGEDVVKMGFATNYVKRENIPKLEQSLREKITGETTLEDVKNIIKPFETPVTEGPYTNFEEIKYYFDNQESIWTIHEKL